MAKTQEAATGQVRITLVRSTIGRPEAQRNAVKSLGLRKLNHSVVRNDEPGIRGICNQISHLVTVEEVTGQ